MSVLAMALAFGAGAAPLAAQGVPGRVVTPQQMAAAMKAGAVVIEVGPPDAYRKEHLPGARALDFEDVSSPMDHTDPSKLILELPDPVAFERTLSRLGVSDDSQVYLYWSGGWGSPTMRVLFTLDWAGLGDRVHVLDGGIEAWKADGYEVTAEVPAPGSGHVTVRPRSDLVVDADWVRAHGRDPGVQLVDARAPAYFDGLKEDGGVKGHIEGAGNVPFSILFDDDGKLLDRATLATVLAKGGVEDGDTVVAYCHVGQYATAALFVARMLGHPVKLYDGSFQDWVLRGLPAVTTPNGS